MNQRAPDRRPSVVLMLVAATGLLIGAAGAAGTQTPAAQEPTSRAANPKARANVTGTGQASVPASGAERISWFAGGAQLYVPPYYDHFNGLDISSLTDTQRERFNHWVNTEFCTCAQTGCQRDTIANCYTNDPVCPRAPVRIREILAKVVGSAATAPGAPAPPAK